MKRTHKQIKVQGDVFDFDIDAKKMTIVNQSEYTRLHKFYKSKINTLANRIFGPEKTYISGYSVEDIVQELSLKLVTSVVKYNPKKECFNTFFWRNCLNRISDIERVELHSREIKRHEGTEKAWLAEQARSVSMPLPFSAKNYDSDEDFNMSKHEALSTQSPRAEFLIKLSDYVLKEIL
jgi:hypothetical protein